MKFSENLASHITPEWRKQYIQYEEMKAMIYYARETAPSPEVAEESVIIRHFAIFKEEFFRVCEGELIKINTFFSEKLAEASRKHATLKSELYNLLQRVDFTKKKHAAEKIGAHFKHIKNSQEGSKPVKLHDLKFAYSEFYLSLILLQNYQELNFQGFRKIFKKFDKVLHTDDGEKWRKRRVENASFYLNKDINKLIRDTERTVTRELYSGDRHKAMKRLRVPPLSDEHYPWVTFSVGLFFGAFAVLICAIVLTGVYEPAVGDWRIVYRIYRCPFLVIEFVFLIGVNIYGWRKYGVNYVLIFELNPRDHLSEQHLMALSGLFGVMWALSILAFQYSSLFPIPAYTSPVALFTIMTLFLFNPTKTVFYQARFWLLNLLRRILFTPYYPVGFADFWFADQLNSLGPSLVDLNFVICFYSSAIDWHSEKGEHICITGIWQILRPIIACLPAWFRFAQCLRRYWETKEAFPHLANAAKYSTTFFNVTFSSVYAATKNYYGFTWDNPFFILWVIFAVISSCFSYIWDIKMDWGLFDRHATGDNLFLREEVVYPSWYYYIAIVEDLFLRFTWAVSVSLTELGLFHTEVMLTVLAPCEVFRRFVWNFFRLENEHLNNCGKFRAVRDISIAPLGSGDPSTLMSFMDEEDGIELLKKRKQKASVRNLILSPLKSKSSDSMDEENGTVKRRRRTLQYVHKKEKPDTSISVEENDTDDSQET